MRRSELILVVLATSLGRSFAVGALLRCYTSHWRKHRKYCGRGRMHCTKLHQKRRNAQRITRLRRSALTTLVIRNCQQGCSNLLY
jgi:hypothetical protein